MRGSVTVSVVVLALAVATWGAPGAEGVGAVEALLGAVEAGNLATVTALLDRGVDPNAADENGATAVMWACQSGNLEILKVLVARGGDPKRKGIIWVDEKHETWYGSPLCAAAGRGHNEVVLYLLDTLHLDVNDPELLDDGKTPGGDTALTYAAGNGSEVLIRELLRRGASPTYRSTEGFTALMAAAYLGCAPCVSELVDAGARVEARDKNGWTALHYAASQDRSEVIPALVRAGADPDAVNAEGATPLVQAAAGGHADAVRTLLAVGADPNIVTDEGKSALGLAVGHDDMVAPLAAAGALLAWPDWDPCDRAKLLDDLGGFYSFHGDKAKALECYQQVLPIERAVGDRAGEATTLHNIGLVYFGLGEKAKALEYFEQALPIRRAVGDRKGEATTLNNIGKVYSDLGEQAKALEYYQQALPIERAVSDRAGEATTFNNIGSAYWSLGEQAKALEYYQQTLPIRRAVGDRKGEATTLNNIATVYSALGEQAKALEYSEQALLIERSVGDRKTEAVTLNNIGLVYSALGEQAKALEYYEQALPIRRAVGDRTGEATTLHNIGLVYSDLGEQAKALEYYQLALPAFRAVDDRAGEAVTLNNIGKVYSDLGEKAKALEYYQQALSIVRAVGDRAGEAGTLNAIGLVYSDLGEQAKALDYYQQALPIERAVGDRKTEAATLNNIGGVYDIGDKANALNYYQKALPIERAVGDHTGEATTLNNIGAVYSALGEKANALEYYEQALPIRRAVGDRKGEATTLNNIGLVYSDLGEQAKALEYYEQALPIERAVGDRAGEAGTLDNLMSLHQGSGHPRLAVFYGKQSVNLYQELRANIQGLPKETQKTYLKTVESTYRALADILIAQGRLPEALQVLDLLKQEEYLTFVKRDAGEASSLSARATLTPSEGEWAGRYATVADPLADLGRKRTDLEAKKARSPMEDAELAKANADLEAALKAFKAFADQLAQELGKPEAAGAPVLQVRETQDLMRDLRELGAGTVALYTLVGEKNTRVILVTPDTLRAGESTITSADLEAKVEAFREALQHPAADPRPLAQELYRTVVGPITKDLEQAQAQTLMWSLDGVLRYLPVAALHDGNQYLVERCRNVVFTPASNARLKESPSLAWRGVGLGVSHATEGFDALPGVPSELKGIFRDESAKSSTGVIPGTVLLDEAFTASAMNAAIAKGAPVVHLASHFQFVPGNETASFLLLGDKDKTKNHLTLDQVRTANNLFAGVELLTLSACQTAMGGEANGTEVEGLAVLAQRQGAKAVIATLWPVADASTSVLMRELYRLREATPGTPKIEALRQAQLALLEGRQGSTAEAQGARGLANPKGGSAGQAPAGAPRFEVDPARPYAHPYYWAPFILFGNWR